MSRTTRRRPGAPVQLRSGEGYQPWTGVVEPARVAPDDLKGHDMAVRNVVAQYARRLADALEPDAPQGSAAAALPPGARETEDPALFRPIVYGDPDRLHVATTAIVNNALF